MSRVLSKKISELTDQEIERIYDWLRRPQPGSSDKYCCVSFEEAKEIGLILAEEKSAPRIRIPTHHKFTPRFAAVNFCPWCGTSFF